MKETELMTQLKTSSHPSASRNEIVDNLNARIGKFKMENDLFCWMKVVVTFVLLHYLFH